MPSLYPGAGDDDDRTATRPSGHARCGSGGAFPVPGMPWNRSEPYPAGYRTKPFTRRTGAISITYAIRRGPILSQVSLPRQGLAPCRKMHKPRQPRPYGLARPTVSRTKPFPL